jgi:hypothetical protein
VVLDGFRAGRMGVVKPDFTGSVSVFWCNVIGVVSHIDGYPGLARK